MQCQDVRSQLSAYLEDELEAAQRRVVEDHVRQCVRCQGELVLLQRTIALLRGLDDVEVPRSLSAAIQAGIRARRRRRWREMVSWLFFPIHVKLPIQAVALLLVSLGAVYLYRTAPELAQAPQPQVATESGRYDQPAPAAPPARDDVAAKAPAKQSAPEPVASSKSEQKPAEGPSRQRAAEVQVQRETAEERGRIGERDASARALRKEAAAPAVGALAMPDLILKTSDPARASSRVVEIVDTLGGKLVEQRNENQLVLTIPAQAYPQFLAAIRELGDLVSAPAEPPSMDVSKAALTLSLRLIP